MTRDGAALVWLRHDLRLDDNPALAAALRSGRPILPVFIWSPEEEQPWAPGAASRWWLHQSLMCLHADLSRRGAKLIVCRGSALECLCDVITRTNASAVYWNHRYEPAVVDRDERVSEVLRQQGLLVERFHGNLLFEPGSLVSRQGRPYTVFTPFWRTCLSQPEPARPASPGRKAWNIFARRVRSLSIDDLRLEPQIDWAAGMRAAWQPGETGAQENLRRFVRSALGQYDSGRDLPDQVGTSRLSPHLHFGEISPRRVWHTIAKSLEKTMGSRAHAETYLRELGWREFAYHLLVHFPRLQDEPLREHFSSMPWRDDQNGLIAWQRGRTGYPLVDAGMRELWTTGWMHNRVRMIAASFLVKHLLIQWREGARWFWDTLVDADLANNTLGWQWVAGCGPDAAPFFRIFNPVVQGERFDPEGAYVRRWVPELARLPDWCVHQPWTAPGEVLAQAGVKLGETYPAPIVDHARARRRALDALRSMRRETSTQSLQKKYLTQRRKSAKKKAVSRKQ